MRISLKSRLDGGFVAKTGLEPINDVQHCVDELIARLGQPSIAGILSANVVLPVLRT